MIAHPIDPDGLLGGHFLQDKNVPFDFRGVLSFFSKAARMIAKIDTAIRNHRQITCITPPIGCAYKNDCRWRFAMALLFKAAMHSAALADENY